MKKVVIVESPSKAKTIHRYLGDSFEVLASYGHVRDLPSKNGSVDPAHDFAMTWEMDERSQKYMALIMKALKGANELYLATDPDREGEAISWHVLEVLKEKGMLRDLLVKRIVFHEITKNAVQRALENPRDIDEALVQAYLARRALDYLVGFTLSPLLWRKLPGSRSAGRVQSVALRLIVDREAEIEAFTIEEYWSITADCATSQKAPFAAKLTHYDGKKLEKFDLNTEALAKATSDAVKTSTFTVSKIEKKQVRRNPQPPFITSTLQQEASRKLGFSASRTMQIAQRLYEGVGIGGETTGLITYMRTDSLQVSAEAIQSMREFIGSEMGASYLPGAVRTFKNKSKNAQEAHEAIRPTQISRTPREVAKFLDESQFKLYELIWKRTLASQMEQAVFDQVIVDLTSSDGLKILHATGSTLVFDGFLKLYQEGVDEGAGSASQEDERWLPPMKEGESILLEQVMANQHFTQPPPRFTEASLVKKMEELGIGRPSTYASILSVLQDRNYVRLEKRQFFPENLGRVVTTFLLNFFPRYVEYDFTAHMEEQLDEISSGQGIWQNVLEQFWSAFKATVESTQNLSITEVIDTLERDLILFLFKTQDPSVRECPTCGEGRISLKLSKFGAFLGCSRYPDCTYRRSLTGTGEKTVETVEPVVLGTDPETRESVSLRRGPYGYYLQWEPSKEVAMAESSVELQEEGEKKPKKTKAPSTKTKASSAKKEAKPKVKRVPLPPNLSSDSITLEMACQLKALPKKLGIHPETGEEIAIGIGRFGPYVKFGAQFASLPKQADLFATTLDEAVEIIAQKGESKRKRPPLKKVPEKASAKVAVPAKKSAVKKKAVSN